MSHIIYSALTAGDLLYCGLKALTDINKPENDIRTYACISRTFLTTSLPSKIGSAAYVRNIMSMTTEPATPALYVVKLPVEIASVRDCHLASYCTRANAPTFCRCIGIF
jgi:hypothetical protein